MKITMLGTGNALVTECYNTCFIISDNDNKRNFLIDGGGGNFILRQLKISGFDLNDIHDIFITHKHIDHLLGIIWIIRIISQRMNRQNYNGDVKIYANNDVIETLTEICRNLLLPYQFDFINKRIFFINLQDGEKKNIIGHDVKFFDIHSERTKQFGFNMDIEKGILTCCGDEPYNDSYFKYANGSEWLLHEAFCLYSQIDIFSPYEKHHSTVKDACEHAKILGIKNLLIYHTEDKNLSQRKELYLNEGKKYFNGKIFVPYDLETIIL